MMKTLSLILVLMTGVASAATGEGTIDVALDMKAASTWQWVGVDLDTESVSSDAETKLKGWDLRFLHGPYSFYGLMSSHVAGPVSTNAGAAYLAGSDFETVTEVTRDASRFISDAVYDAPGPAPEDKYNRELMSWYVYHRSEDHLLEPRQNVYVIMRSDGSYAKIQIVDFIMDGKAIREVEKKDKLGRVTKKKRSTQVAQSDGKIHIVLRYSLF